MFQYRAEETQRRALWCIIITAYRMLGRVVIVIQEEEDVVVWKADLCISIVGEIVRIGKIPAGGSASRGEDDEEK